MDERPAANAGGVGATVDFADSAEPLLVRVDAAFRALEWSGDPEVYDIELQPGMDVREAVEYLAGTQSSQSASFPMIWFQGNRPINAYVLPVPARAEAYIIVQDANATDMADRELRRQAEKSEILEYRVAQLESELQQAKKEAALASELKSRFISGMSHEFKTPVTSVLGYCDLLEKEHGRDDRRVQGIRRSSTHLLSLVENLLEHGRVVADRIEPVEEAVHLRRLFESIYLMFEPLAAQKKLDFAIREQDCQADEILTDPVRVRQIIVNLISNALRYTENGEVRVLWSQSNDRLRVSVHDTGPGIPEDKRRQIFQAFSSLEDEHTRAKGLGLGLSISQHLAEVLGGDINLKSEIGKGSVFSFEIRAPAAQPKTITAPMRAVGAEQKARRLLLVEDDMDVREFLAVVLADQGYSATLALNGRQALDKLHSAGADLVLTDFHLGDISGESFIREVRDSGIPVIAMSASNAEADRNSAFEAGCSAYLVKPFDLDQLMKELEKASHG
ncbi:MAG: ATP-binding protein [Xanthomonadales bacterium]|nr:ATP-binding protein [Xanthomonadales bacterium]